MEICERCDRRVDHWRVTEARLDVGELHRKPHLCDECTVTVMSALIVVLRPLRLYDKSPAADAVGLSSDEPGSTPRGKSPSSS